MVDFKPNFYEEWVEVERPYPYKLFYQYYEYEYQKKTYYDRRNRLDGFFDWICRMCRKVTG